MLEKRKVSYIYGYKYEEVPLIKLTGKWLKKLGFNIGDNIHIVYDKGIIVLMKEEKQNEKIN